jgi:hypothetical protein
MIVAVALLHLMLNAPTLSPVNTSTQGAVADSAALRLAVLTAVLDTFGIAPTQPRIWLAPYRVYDAIAKKGKDVPFTTVELDSIQRHYPGVMPVADAISPFRCPPGITVKMPGQGCPIAENGIIVRSDR